MLVCPQASVRETTPPLRRARCLFAWRVKSLVQKHTKKKKKKKKKKKEEKKKKKKKIIQ
eukprot:NODE_25974_length_569_cov_2.334842.p3 GENE.NODE_25974_length_569_cov_2.334842~~NODE_25974_length_569_cov_2.334842.p3  ORF type:complete len:59 (-),score=42.07 NODE_25974_length_569_cov_2.334842:117-293(-)